MIVDTGVDSVTEAVTAAHADDRLRTVMLEVPVPVGSDLPRARPGWWSRSNSAPEVRLHVELPRSAGWREALDVLEGAGRGAKFRTGGLTQELFPSDAELAAFVLACRERRPLQVHSRAAPRRQVHRSGHRVPSPRRAQHPRGHASGP